MIPASYLFKTAYYTAWEEPTRSVAPQDQHLGHDGLATRIETLVTALRQLFATGCTHSANAVTSGR